MQSFSTLASASVRSSPFSILYCIAYLFIENFDLAEKIINEVRDLKKIEKDVEYFNTLMRYYAVRGDFDTALMVRK